MLFFDSTSAKKIAITIFGCILHTQKSKHIVHILSKTFAARIIYRERRKKIECRRRKRRRKKFMMEIATQRIPLQIRLRSRRAIQVTTNQMHLKNNNSHKKKWITDPENSNNILNRNKIMCMILMWLREDILYAQNNVIQIKTTKITIITITTWFEW